MKYYVGHDILEGAGDENMTIDIYEGYFKADYVFDGVERRAVKVDLTCESGEGMVSYGIGLAFFPHVDEEDYAVSYDAFMEKELYKGKGRRSKKREEEMLRDLSGMCDDLARQDGATIYWDCPLGKERTA